MAETPERIEDHSIIEEMQDSYLTYAMSVITARALPDGRDGLKPSQRRILVAMNDLNLGPRAQHRKCAKIAGDTAGNYHPHGDQVIYPTLVRMAQHWNMRKTLVDGQGNFGSMDGDAPAAMRYTEARLTAASMDMLADLEFETVDFEPNYDGTRTEPVAFRQQAQRRDARSATASSFDFNSRSNTRESRSAASCSFRLGSVTVADERSSELTSSSNRTFCRSRYDSV